MMKHNLLNTKNMIRAGIAVVLTVTVALTAGYFLVLRTDAPDAVSTDAGLTQLAEDKAAEPATSQPNQPTGVQGKWSVDDDFGTFGFDTASGSFAGFRVGKEFPGGVTATGVGRTGGVTGELTIDGDKLTKATITVDMTKMESDDPGRVDAIKNAVDTAAHPTATFQSTAPAQLDGQALVSGNTVTATVTGDLTIKGTTKQVSLPIEATLAADGVGLVIGTVDLTWADFGVETPESSIAKVADHGTLEFQAVVRRS